VSVSSPLPFIRSYRIEFYFSVSAVRTGLQLRPVFCAGNSAPFSRALRPASWACRAITAHRPQQQRHERLVRTRFLRKRYDNSYGYGNGFTATDTECWKSGITRLIRSAISRWRERERERERERATSAGLFIDSRRRGRGVGGIYGYGIPPPGGGRGWGSAANESHAPIPGPPTEDEHH